MFVATLLAAIVILAACEGESGGGKASDENTQSEETTAAPSGEERMLEVRRIDSGSFGRGGVEPRAVVAASVESLSAAGIRLRDTESTTGSGEGTYVAVLWGEKNTGGYSIEVESAKLEGGRVEVEVSRSSPPEGAIVSQALTYPYAVVEIPNLDPANKEFVIVDENGRELGWSVETAG
jgi:hypothetical protein